MTKDEIMQALRLTAMGRAGHPLQEQLAEELAGLLDADAAAARRAAEIEADLEQNRHFERARDAAEAAKRTRKTKAE